MLDIKFIKENPELVREAARKKHLSFDLDHLLALEEKRLKTLAEFETIRARQNALSADIPRAQDEERQGLLETLKGIKEEVADAETRYREVLKSWQALMLEVPNVPDVSVPEGKDDSENAEVRSWGEKPAFSFTPQDHVALMEALDLVDFDRGAKVAGFRGYFLKNDAVRLQFALWNYFLDDILTRGFSPMTVPSLVNKTTLYGTGYLPQGEEDLYRTQDDTYLSGTGEVGAMAYYADEVLSEAELPKKIVAFSPCFRREAGAHGRDVKGLVRVHEFYKLEQVVLCAASHEESVSHHEAMTENVERLLQGLGLHYRVVANCGGDLGLGQVKKYDIEVWMPSQGKYRETHSASYFHDFQTRRLNIRYRDESGKLRYAHSLNNTLVATPSRIIPAIMENFQDADGGIVIPEVLRPYLAGKERVVKT